MAWKLWLDDDAGKPGIEDFRNPPKDAWGKDEDMPWKVAHSVKEAKQLICEFGIPEHIDFDHDLGMNEHGQTETAMHFLRWLAEEHVVISDDANSGVEQVNPNWFNFNVHSRNSEGSKNIISFMNSWKKVSKL